MANPGKYIAYFLLGILLSTKANAQSVPGFVTWSDFNFTYGFNTTWGTGGDAGVRGLISDPNRTLLYLRPIFIYRNTDQLNFGFSVAAFQNFNRAVPDMFEFRPAQQVNLVWPQFKRWNLKSRIRLEERYLVQLKTEGFKIAEPGWEFRGRYELKFKTEPFDVGFIKRTYVLASGEYFIPLGEEGEQLFADQSRLLIGYGQRIGQRWSYELHFFWLRTRNTFEASLQTDQYVLRLRVFLRNQPREFVNED